MSNQPRWQVARWFVIALLVMGGLLLGGLTLVGFFARSHWRLEQACHFRVQYFWGLAVVAVALVLSKQRRLALVAAALAAINLAVVLPLFVGPAPRNSAGSPTRAMSLNVRWKNHEYQAVRDLVAQEDPDILAFFEVTNDWVKELSPLEQSHPHFKLLPHRDQGGIAFYSRFSFENLRVEADTEIRLPTVVAELKHPSGPLTVLATHPPSPISPGNFEFRNRQLAEVAGWAQQARGAVMVIGDLNTSGWSPYFQDLLSASGLRDSRHGFGVEASWPNLPAPLRIPIDHCLVSPSIEIHNRRIGPDVGSDHRPVIIDFAIRGAENAKATRE